MSNKPKIPFSRSAAVLDRLWFPVAVAGVLGAGVAVALLHSDAHHYVLLRGDRGHHLVQEQGAHRQEEADAPQWKSQRYVWLENVPRTRAHLTWLNQRDGLRYIIYVDSRELVFQIIVRAFIGLEITEVAPFNSYWQARQSQRCEFGISLTVIAVIHQFDNSTISR